MLDNYEKLNDGEKEHFKKVVSSILEHTYIFKYDFSDNQSMRQSDDYYFVKRNKDVINEYLNLIGYEISIDEVYGICYISTFPSSARARFGKLTTTLIFTLRHIYESKRDSSDGTSVKIKIGELVSAYEDLSDAKKKPSNKEIAFSLRTIANAHLMLKGKGDYESAETEILILPSILLVLSQDRIIELKEQFAKDID